MRRTVSRASVQQLWRSPQTTAAIVFAVLAPPGASNRPETASRGAHRGADRTKSRVPVGVSRGTLVDFLDLDLYHVDCETTRRRFVWRCLLDQPVAFFRERRFGFASASTVGASTLSAAAEVLFLFS
jgi:hypothetical protein